MQRFYLQVFTSMNPIKDRCQGAVDPPPENREESLMDWCFPQWGWLVAPSAPNREHGPWHLTTSGKHVETEEDQGQVRPSQAMYQSLLWRNITEGWMCLFVQAVGYIECHLHHHAKLVNKLEARIAGEQSTPSHVIFSISPFSHPNICESLRNGNTWKAFFLQPAEGPCQAKKAGAFLETHSACATFTAA